MIVYPLENYDSWISQDDADEYFLTRLNASEWDAGDTESALVVSNKELINAKRRKVYPKKKALSN